MKKVSTNNLVAKKISGQGEIEYSLWVDGEGWLYIKIESVNGGTFSDMLFSISRYALARNAKNEIADIEGYDIKTGSMVRSRNNNDSAFLKAVLKNLIDTAE
jgi:hypothetical protein